MPAHGTSPMVLRVLLTTTCVVAVSLGLAETAIAACVAADLSTSPAAAAPAATVTLTGRGYASECRDTGQTEPAPPRADIELVFEQSGQSQVLAVVDADAEYVFSTSVSIPSSATPGPAVLIARSSRHQPVSTSFTVVPGDVSASAPREQRLPRTGRHSATLAGLGVALVLAGAGAMHAGRPRPSAGRRRRVST